MRTLKNKTKSVFVIKVSLRNIQANFTKIGKEQTEPTNKHLRSFPNVLRFLCHNRGYSLYYCDRFSTGKNKLSFNYLVLVTITYEALAISPIKRSRQPCHVRSIGCHRCQKVALMYYK